VAADAALMGAEEAALADALGGCRGEVPAISLDGGDYDCGTRRARLASRARSTRSSITVLVMDSEDEALRDNRLRQLNRFVALFERFADFSRLAG
jgi:glycyl-tRNA synthetase beta chain